MPAIPVIPYGQQFLGGDIPRFAGEFGRKRNGGLMQGMQGGVLGEVAPDFLLGGSGPVGGSEEQSSGYPSAFEALGGLGEGGAYERFREVHPLGGASPSGRGFTGIGGKVYDFLQKRGFGAD